MCGQHLVEVMRNTISQDSMFGREGFHASKIRKNPHPYIVALRQSLEEYRNNLAIDTGVSSAVQMPSDQIEGIFLARYNKQTVNQLSALYQTLNEPMLSALFATSRTIYIVKCTRRIAVAVVGLSHRHG